MWNPYTVIETILVTEKSMDLKEENKYLFKVSRSANKIEVRRAVEDIYNVKVGSVSIINRKGKPKRVGRGRYKMGKRPDAKRAIVTLTEGTIEVL